MNNIANCTPVQYIVFRLCLCVLYSRLSTQVHLTTDCLYTSVRHDTYCLYLCALYRRLCVDLTVCIVPHCLNLTSVHHTTFSIRLCTTPRYTSAPYHTIFLCTIHFQYLWAPHIFYTAEHHTTFSIPLCTTPRYASAPYHTIPLHHTTLYLRAPHPSIPLCTTPLSV